MVPSGSVILEAIHSLMREILYFSDVSFHYI